MDTQPLPLYSLPMAWAPDRITKWETAAKPRIADLADSLAIGEQLSRADY
jgi:hypothetical protein